jgi:hypothetical protein
MDSINPSRRRLLSGAAAIGLMAGIPALAQPSRMIEVWKDPNCGCCQDWIDHVEQAGFKAKVNQTGNNAVRARLGMPQKLGSCHTALVQGYVIEGHVPAQDIERLLKERPQALGLAVPGMPIGSPGMDGAVYGGRRDRYDVLLVLKDGSTRVFSSHNTTPTSTQAEPLAEGEIRRLDPETGKLTIRHGEIRSLDMPPMTMVFTARDKAQLAGLKVGDRIRFAAVHEGGKYLVTDIQPIK